MPIIFRSYFRLQQADHMLILFWSFFGLQQADHMPILFRVTAGRSYFCTRRNTWVTAGKTTMTASKINYGCFEMLSWPHRTSNNIINICFWLLETCTKCSYVIEENMRRGAQPLGGIWSEVRAYRALIHEYTMGQRSAVGQVSRQLALDVLKGLDYSLVSTENVSQKIPFSGWGPGPDNLSKKGLNLPHLWHNP